MKAKTKKVVKKAKPRTYWAVEYGSHSPDALIDAATWWTRRIARQRANERRKYWEFSRVVKVQVIS